MADLQLLATIKGLASNATVDDVTLDGTTVKLSMAAFGDQTIEITSNYYTLGFADDVKFTSGSWSVSNGTAKYSPGSADSHVLSSDKKKITYNADADSVIIIGLNTSAKLSDISIDSTTKVVTLSAAAVGERDITVSGNFTLALENGIDEPDLNMPSWEVSGGTAKYLSESTSAGYTLSSDGKTITYTANSPAQTLATVTGLKSSATESDFSLYGGVITLKASALDGKNVTVTGDYTLALANDVTEPTHTETTWNISGSKASYVSSSSTAGYTLSADKKSVDYTTRTNQQTLATVTGLDSSATTSDFSVSGNTVTLKSGALKKTGAIKISEGYTLALVSGVTKSETKAAAWNVSETVASYTTQSVSKGYAISSDGRTINYVTASGGSMPIVFSGVKRNSDADSITLKGKTVTIDSSIIGSKGVSVVGGGYNFQLTGAGKLTNISKSAQFKGSSEKDTLIGGSSKDTILSYAGADYLSGGAGNDYLSGGSGKDVLIGGSGVDYLRGGKGNDTLRGGIGKDTLTGGAGKDVFVYSAGAGKDVITDYTAVKDKIQIDFGSISKTKISGQNVIFTVGSGTLTVQNGKGKKITIIDENGSETFCNC